jgi:hypothetical protein
MCQGKSPPSEKINMQVKFRLKMENAVIGTKYVRYFEIEWQENLSRKELAERFNAWLNDEFFIRNRLPDLKEAGFCQLQIDPS